MGGGRTIVGSGGGHEETPWETVNIELHHSPVEETPGSVTRITQGSIAEAGTCTEPTFSFKCAMGVAVALKPGEFYLCGMTRHRGFRGWCLHR